MAAQFYKVYITSRNLPVFGIEAIPLDFLVGKSIRRLCERETFRIFTLDTLSPYGLNEEIETHTLT